jgi:hypothetical protein
MSSKYKNAPIKNFVNNSFGVTQKQEAKFQKYAGKNFSGIDLQLNPELKPSDYPVKPFTEIGSLKIGNAEMVVTKAEAEKIIETLQDALHTVDKKFRLNIFN